MGYFYFSSIRCDNKWAAGHIAQRYDGQTFVFVEDEDGTVCRFGASTNEVPGDGCWVDICPRQITESGIANAAEARRASEFCNVMYGMLRNEKHFDFALCGVEVQEFRTLKELRGELAEWPDKVVGRNWIISRFDGLVVSKGILKDFPKASEEFQPFSETHLWIPKLPEKFNDTAPPL